MDFVKLLKSLRGVSASTAINAIKGMAQILTGKQVATPSQLRQAEGLMRSVGRLVKESPQRRPAPLPGWRQRNGGGGSSRPPASPPAAAPVPPEPRGQSGEPSLQDLDPFTVGLVMGTMYDVQTSSNVHSIGMRVESPTDRTGELYVRFLGTTGDGQRSGMGSLYAYHDVPTELFREFLSASSKGEFVWDNLRVRGTIAGHRYSYDLAGVVGGYVPRQAAIKTGQAGQFFIKRTFADTQLRQGRLVRVNLQSQLPEALASLRGPNPQRGPGAQSLRFGPGGPISR